MEKQVKEKIKELFKAKCKQLELSQGRAAVAAGTKGATISQVFSGKYAANDEAVYRLLARWVGYDAHQWQVVPTVNFKFMTRILDAASMNGQAYMVVGSAGFGKTEAQKHYATTHRNAFHLRCDEFWTKQMFLHELLKQMGKDHGWQSLPEMMQNITNSILQMDNPIIMIDEADKLRNDVLYLFISLYNRLEDHCGLVMCGTDHLSKRIDRGLKFNWKGYHEIFSRVGRKPVELVKTKSADVKAICVANGIVEDQIVQQITHECQGDLRRVKRAVDRQKLAS